MEEKRHAREHYRGERLNEQKEAERERERERERVRQTKREIDGERECVWGWEGGRETKRERERKEERGVYLFSKIKRLIQRIISQQHILLNSLPTIFQTQRPIYVLSKIWSRNPTFDDFHLLPPRLIAWRHSHKSA